MNSKIEIPSSGSSSTSAGRKGSAATIKSSFLDWSAEQSALQLTHMSKRLWDSLSLWEFYDVAFTKKDKDELCPNINALIRHVNRVGDWAKTLVLLHEDTKKRSQGEEECFDRFFFPFFFEAFFLSQHLRM